MSTREHETLLPSFFSRNGLSKADLDQCHEFAAATLPRCTIEATEQQGGCSYTLVAQGLSHELGTGKLEHVGPSKTIVQFRLLKHAIVLQVAEAASLLTALAPETRSLAELNVGDGVVLQVVSMKWRSGRRFSDVQPQYRVLSLADFSRLQSLLGCLSQFLAETWRSALKEGKGMERCSGKVGRSLLLRLEKLARELPTRQVRAEAERVVITVRNGGLYTLPVVLTHGDLLPSNILVEPVLWRLRGVIDWAEAEWLPFGICLYGLEHLLGYLETAVPETPRWVYYERADELRDEFWSMLREQISELDDPRVLDQVMLARDVGILLWKGFAWDDGAIDRVVNSVEDGEEVACLEAFLGVRSKTKRHDSVLAETRPPLLSTVSVSNQ